MPFDGLNQVKSGWFARLFHRSDKARELSHLLRHRELWPAGFRWNYGMHMTCAIGLAQRRWYLSDCSMATLGRKLDIPEKVAYAIFIYLRPCSASLLGYGVRFEEITPEHVADAIDAYLIQQNR